MKKVLALIVALIVLALLAFVLFIINVANAPYKIPEEQISKENLDSLTTVGKYELMRDFGTNPVEVDGVYVAFYTEDGELVDDPDDSTQIVIAQSEELFESLKESVDKEETCTNRSSGTVNEISYVRGDCGATQIYVYKLADDTLVGFQVQGSKEDFEEVIEDFVGE